MQVDAKFLLQDVTDHRLLTNALHSLFIKEENYKDYFFDFPNSLLAQRATVLRLRVPFIINNNNNNNNNSNKLITTPTLTLKEHSKVERGEQVFGFQQLQQVPEVMVKEMLKVSEIGGNVLEILGRYADEIPTTTTTTTTTLSLSLQKEKEEKVIVNPLQEIVKSLESITAEAATSTELLELHEVGSYRTHRKIYKYICLQNNSKSSSLISGNKIDTSESKKEDQYELFKKSMHIRVDETSFPFGKMYELEVSNITVPLIDVMIELENFLRSLGVKYSLSLESKYARFMKYIQGLSAPREGVKAVKLRIMGINGYKEVLHWMKSNREGIISTLSKAKITKGGGAVVGLMHSTPSQVSINPVSLSQERVGDDYLYNNKRETSIISCSSQNSISQQTLTGGGQENNNNNNNNNGGEKNFNNESEGKIEYQENYYFDDAPCGKLLGRRCFARLRCINHGSAFIFDLKEEQSVMRGSQNGSTRRVELSGDVARLLLRDPTQFLISQREYNTIANALWLEFGLEKLSVVAFFRTQRCFFTRFISNAALLPYQQKQQQCYYNDNNNNHHDEENEEEKEEEEEEDFIHNSQQDPIILLNPNENKTELYETASMISSYTGVNPCLTEITPPVSFNLDRTLYDFTHSAEDFARIAAESPACSPPPPINNNNNNNAILRELYELEVTGLTAVNQHAVKRWVGAELGRLGVEWRPGIQSKVEQYFTFADAPGSLHGILSQSQITPRLGYNNNNNNNNNNSGSGKQEEVVVRAAAW